jgi:uncharacterized protein YkwD
VRRAFRILRVGAVLIALAGVLTRPGDDAQGVPDTAACPGSGTMPSPAAIQATREAVICLLNAERAKHGLLPLRHHPLLELASQRHSDDMARRKFFEHDTPDGVDPQERMTAVGYRPPWTGENLYAGTDTEATPVRALDGWMNSPGHRANILRPEFTEVGVGVAYSYPRAGAEGRAAVYTTDFGGS